MRGTHRPNMKLSTAATRGCLSCDKPFDSEGPWNRICGTCSGEHERKQPQAQPTARVLTARQRRFHVEAQGAHDSNAW